MYDSTGEGIASGLLVCLLVILEMRPISLAGWTTPPSTH